ncbi:hypothetical protein [Actinophytocola sp.]|uniref:hypothetical protein n=1 Tax=Actinophytocola sp. TaxID=1872138 RepID=UPI003899CBFF
MQTWAKRGLRTALVTGGLLMLGTGIASADEDVNPDKPASALDGAVSNPINFHNSTAGTPLGGQAAPNVERGASIGTFDVTNAVPANQVTTALHTTVATVRQTATEQVAPAADLAVTEADKAAAELAAPVMGKVRAKAASATQDARDQAAPFVASTRSVADGLPPMPSGGTPPYVPSGTDGISVSTPEAQDGQHPGLGDAESVPVDLSSKAVALAGNASAQGTSSQAALAAGDTLPTGALGGNVAEPQPATPVQVGGNAAAGGGNVVAMSSADTFGEAGRFVLASGEDSLLGGSTRPVSVAAPAKVDGDAITAVSRTIAKADSTAAHIENKGNPLDGFGGAGSALTEHKGLAGSITGTDAGGDTTTSGHGGAVDANAVSPQATPLARSLAAVASGVSGRNASTTSNQANFTRDSGTISGNLLDGPPPTGVVRKAADAVGSKPAAVSAPRDEAGGTAATRGPVPGLNPTQAVGPDFLVHEVPTDVLAKALAESPNLPATRARAEEEPQLHNLPVGVMEATELPTLMPVSRSMPSDSVLGSFSGVLPAFGRELPELPFQQPVDLPAQDSLPAPVADPQVLPEPPRILPAPVRDRSALTDTVPLGNVTTLLGGAGLPGNLFGGQRDLPELPVATPNLGTTVPGLPGGIGGYDRDATDFPLSFVPGFGQLNDDTRDMRAVPSDITAILPVIPAAPAVPAAPVSSNPPKVSMSVFGRHPQVDASTLDSTRAALADLFATHPIG